MAIWSISGLEFNVVTKDQIYTNKRILDCIDLISGAVNGVFMSYQHQTRIESEWNKQCEYDCVLAKDYYISVKLLKNKYLNNIKSILESWISSIEEGSILNKVIEILNCDKLSIVLTHYGYYDTIIGIQKLMSFDPIKPTQLNIMEAIAATEQFDLMSFEFFESEISHSNALNMIIINNEFNHHSNKITELLFYQLCIYMILKPKEWKVRSSINNCSRRYHKAMFRKLQYYHYIDNRHNNHRIQLIVFGYFRKYSKILPKTVYYNIPLQAMFICWSYYNDYDDQIQLIQNVINKIPKNTGQEMERFCTTKQYQELKDQNKYFRKYYGNLYCNSFGSYQLENVYKDHTVAILGYLMISNSKYIVNILNDAENEWNLKSKLFSFYNKKNLNRCYVINEMKLKLMAKHLIKCDEDRIIWTGIEYIKDVYENSKCGIKNIAGNGSNTIYVPNTGEMIHFVVAEMLIYIYNHNLIEETNITEMFDTNEYFPKNKEWKYKSLKQKCENAIIFHYGCSSLSNSLCLRILSLLKLSLFCYKNKLYLIGLKCLKYGYKLCSMNGQIFPSFVNYRYVKWKQKFYKKRNKLICNYCQKKRNRNNNLRTCSLCMRVIYCCKQCQKLDWHQTHNKLCDKSWDIVYETLNKRLFRRLD